MIEKLKLHKDLYNFVIAKKAFEVKISNKFPYNIKTYSNKIDYELDIPCYEHSLYLFCIQLMEKLIDLGISIDVKTTNYSDFPNDEWFAVASHTDSNIGIVNASGDNFPSVVILVGNHVYRNIIRKQDGTSAHNKCT